MAQLFHDFVAELKKLSSGCQFKTLHDPLTKDNIDCGTNDNFLRERLLCESELTLPKAMSAGHAAAETHKDAHEILKSNGTIDLHKISKHSKFRGQTSTQAKEIIKKCKFCKNSHHRGKCPGYGKVCHICNRKKHFKKCCSCNRKTLETESPSADVYEFFLDPINLHRNLENLLNISHIKNEPSDWNITLSSNGTPISYKKTYWCSMKCYPYRKSRKYIFQTRSSTSKC